jgi:ABC-type cobalamin/Fe3+-siderophores transport system ATPase subunit
MQNIANDILRVNIARDNKKDLQIVDGAIKSLYLEKLTMRHIDRMSGGELQKSDSPTNACF